jgi:hypothetical protein
MRDDKWAPLLAKHEFIRERLLLVRHKLSAKKMPEHVGPAFCNYKDD